MSNLQESLNIKYQDARDKLKDNPDGWDDFDMFKAGYEAALSEIEKCDPVAYLKFISRQWLVGTEIGMDGFQGFEVCDKDEKGDDGSNAFAVYTSPQPRDWVVPSNDVIDTLWHKATHESVAHSEPFTRYRFSELLIKQLNTKG